MHPAAGSAILSVAAAVKPTMGDQASGDSELIAYAIFALSGVIMLGILFQLIYLLIRRRRRAAASLINGSSVCPKDLSANTELVVALLRNAAPSAIQAYLSEGSDGVDGDLQRILTVLQNPYENVLRSAATDGNTYLALARSQRATAALVTDVEGLCQQVEALNQSTITRDHVTMVAAKTMIGGLLLLCALGGLVIGAVQVI